MQLNEVIEENSIATISKRTRISIANIEKLVQRDFSGTKRVKALGFISILEREFGIELDALKKECSDYFSSSPEEGFDARLVVTIPEADEQRGGFAFKLLMLLVLFGIGYGAWYFLVAKENSNENNVTIGTTSFIGTIVNQAKAWLGDSSTLDTDKRTVSDDGVWAKGDVEKNGTTVSPTGKNRAIESTESEKNDSATEEQIIKDVKEQQQEILAQKSEPSGSNVDTFTADEALATEVPSMTNEKTKEAATTIEAILPPEIKVSPKPKREKKSVNKASSIQIVTLRPLKKVWVGYTDLKTMRRAAKVIEDDIDFDTSSTSWILVAGHNTISFVIDGEARMPKKRDKNYFLIKEGAVKEISKEEFQNLNKSTVW